MPVTPPILRLAIPSPLRRAFDYLPPADIAEIDLLPGLRLRVPFGRGKTVGVLLEVAEESEVPAGKLKAALEVLDSAPVLPPDVLGLLRWAAEYYHHPIGEVIAAALPGPLREGRAARLVGELVWCATVEGVALDLDSLRRAPRQRLLLQALRETAGGLRASGLDARFEDWRGVMRRLVEKGWVATLQLDAAAVTNSKSPLPPGEGQGEGDGTGAPRQGSIPESPLALNAEQHQAVEAVSAALGGFQPFVLEGITGSGKTEVYLNLAAQVLARGRQVLILVPEIGLTPQLVGRFEQRFAVPIAVLHSGLADQERFTAWMLAKEGRAPIVIGTRSAVFVPLPSPGLIIVDEEHDPSFKQQEGFRYSARDVAVMRARRGGYPVLLGSATPSLETLYNVEQGRYRVLHLRQRAGAARPPVIRLLDVRRQPLAEGLSEPLMQAMRSHLERGGQVLLFLNRRGYAPTLLCHECGWVAKCRRCDANLVLHQGRARLSCHHCGVERPVDEHCPGCGSVDLRPIGLGTQRIERVLGERFADWTVARIDRDSTRRKGALQEVLEGARAGEQRILIGTQMLAKGHDFPNVTLVGVLDADHGLFGVDFRAGERMAQTILQVAGRAGRAERPGEVLIQTHHPEHPLLRALIDRGYAAFAAQVLQERRQAQLPPVTAMALLRAEGHQAPLALDFLAQARDQALGLRLPGVELLGPVPAPMERRAGRFRAQLVVQAARRADLHRLLAHWVPIVEALKAGRKVRWSLDVDPQEMY